MILYSAAVLRVIFRSVLIAGSALTVVFIFLSLSSPHNQSSSWSSQIGLLGKPHRDPDAPQVPCVGPRGKLLIESADDQLHSRALNHCMCSILAGPRPPLKIKAAYPNPLGGSYKTLGLDQTWMTADGRYGPYGFGDEDPAKYSRSRVDWDSVQWASLQDDCLAKNRLRFGQTKTFAKSQALHMPTKLQRLKSSIASIRGRRRSTGRTAIVVRTWGNYDYKKDDMINLRSLVVEAALSSGGQYAVFLLVHIKDRSKNIFKNAAAYEAALNTAVPPEFRDIAVLFDESLLEAWYPEVGEHSPYRQIGQPMQLFAQTFDGFDHYWQLEMDARLTGNVLNYLETVSGFAKAQPRKQAFERGSFRYIPEVHGDYEELLAAVNSSVEGRGIWGALRIAEVEKPVGQPPPTPDALDDSFEWGVGEDADFIPTVPCKSLPLTTTWLFYHELRGFSAGAMTPRLFCPQAIYRTSWTLLNAVHNAQREKGLYIPSEGTMASFALWHGLKYSHPPQPWYIYTREDIPQDATSVDEVVNGGPPQSTYLGFAFGTNSHDKEVLDHYNWRTEQSWHWRSQLPRDIMGKWLGHDPGQLEGTHLADILVEEDGQIYAPAIWLHPYKTKTDLG